MTATLSGRECFPSPPISLAPAPHFLRESGKRLGYLSDFKSSNSEISRRLTPCGPLHPHFPIRPTETPQVAPADRIPLGSGVQVQAGHSPQLRPHQESPELGKGSLPPSRTHSSPLVSPASVDVRPPPPAATQRALALPGGRCPLGLQSRPGPLGAASPREDGKMPAQAAPPGVTCQQLHPRSPRPGSSSVSRGDLSLVRGFPRPEVLRQS